MTGFPNDPPGGGLEAANGFAPYRVNRRTMLRQAANGFGALACTALFAQAETLGATPLSATQRPLLPKVPHAPARARNVIFLFMEGAVSQVDSFDYKPLLQKYHGQDPRRAIGKLEKTQFENIGQVMQSPWPFRQRGQCGAWISDLFPNVADLADDLCIVRSLTSNFPEHTSA